jgi:YtkA-like
MYVRVAWFDGRCCVKQVWRSRYREQLVASALVCGILGTACDRSPRDPGSPAINDVTVEWKITPTPTGVGALTIAEVTLRDGERRLVSGATIQVEGHMSHPGMAPVIVQATERSEGVYAAQLQFSMNGEWIVLVTGSLPDGRRLSRRLAVANVKVG